MLRSILLVGRIHFDHWIKSSYSSSSRWFI